MRSFARLLIVAAAVLVALPLGAFPRTRHLCRWMGEITKSCCCVSQDDRARPEAIEAFRDPDCCKLITSSNDGTPATRDAAPPLVAALTTVGALPRIELAAPSESLVRAPPQARGQPAVGPPLFLAHCALLI
ncbi:MAG TPA: hypothetical protein VIM73_21660 [Polyangiaceae bacterium]